MAGCEPTDPEQVGFPSARQIAAVTRMVIRKDKKSNETVRLITSLDASKASGKDLKEIKRDYWGIESKLHYRLDNVLDEDRSRVRNPNAALVLGMFRRVVVSFAIPWSEEKKKKNNPCEEGRISIKCKMQNQERGRSKNVPFSATS